MAYPACAADVLKAGLDVVELQIVDRVWAIGGDGVFRDADGPYVKVVNTGSAGNWWSIAEFNLYD